MSDPSSTFQGCLINKIVCSVRIKCVVDFFFLYQLSLLSTVHEEPEVIETQGEAQQIIKKKKIIKKVTKKGVFRKIS